MSRWAVYVVLNHPTEWQDASEAVYELSDESVDTFATQAARDPRVSRVVRFPMRTPRSMNPEDAVTARANEQADNDQNDAEQKLPADDADNAPDHEGDSQKPQ